ncbi:MAG TPA: DUF308 domain-containing protein [Williamwhitmania sp.]|nr:DUF308 domain-containing protein [Williamwhitmania sp.]
MDTKQTTAGQTLGILGIVLGIIAFLISLIPCVGIIAIVPGIIAIVLSAIGLDQARRSNGAKGLGYAALSISIIATLIATAWLFFTGGLAYFVNKMEHRIKTEVVNDSTNNVEITVDQGKDSLIMKLEVLEDGKDSLHKGKTKRTYIRIKGIEKTQDADKK